MAVFAPVVQIHSEKSNPPVNEERTPWNVQTRSGDGTVINHFAKYMNIRMNLLPYIYSEATKTSATGAPLMRAMFLEYPDDANSYDPDYQYQYLFGDNLLVAPIVDQGVTNKDIYLPEENGSTSSTEPQDREVGKSLIMRTSTASRYS